MKTTLDLEYLGQAFDQELRLYGCIANMAVPGIKDVLIGKSLTRRPWVAEIVGRSNKFRLERIFLKSNTSYSTSSNTGNRGVVCWFILESGKVYQVRHFISWRQELRYFCQVTGAGDIVRMSAEEIEAWLNGRLELMY